MRTMDESVYKEKIIGIINNINDENVLEYLYLFIKGKIEAEE